MEGVNKAEIVVSNPLARSNLCKYSELAKISVHTQYISHVT